MRLKKALALTLTAAMAIGTLAGWQLFWHSRDHGKRNNSGSGNGKYCIGRNRKHRCKISGRL